MKIKLAILDSDVNYLSRLTSAFESKYAEKLEVYFFTNKEIAISSLQENRIDMLVASEFFEIDQSKIPNRCGFAYFPYVLKAKVSERIRARYFSYLLNRMVAGDKRILRVNIRAVIAGVDERRSRGTKMNLGSSRAL